MRALIQLALGHLRLEMKDRSNAFWMLIMPVAFIGLFGGLFGDSTRHKTLLRVADEDGSTLSGAFVEMLKGGNLAVREISPAALDSLRGNAITLSLPRGFSDSLSLGRQVALPFSPRGGSRADRDMEAQVQVYLTMARMLGTLAEADTAGRAEVESGSPGGLALPSLGGLGRTGSFSNSAGKASAPPTRHDLESEPFQARFRELLARPDQIRTEVRTAGRGRAVPTGFGGSAQAMLVLFLLMNASISGAVTLTQEKQSRVLARLATLPVTRGQILAGKILGLLGMALAQAAIILLFGRLFFHVWWGPSPVALFLLLVCLGLASAALGIAMGGVLRTPEQASAIGWLIPLFLGAIGGTWWPLEVTPAWMQVFGHISPAAWAMDGMHGLISFGFGAGAVVVPCLALLGYAAVLTWIGAKTLRVVE